MAAGTLWDGGYFGDSTYVWCDVQRGTFLTFMIYYSIDIAKFCSLLINGTVHHVPVWKSHKNFQKILIVLFIKNNYNNLLLIGIH